MSTKKDEPQKNAPQFDPVKIDDWNNRYFLVDRRMQRKVSFEQQKFNEKTPNQVNRPVKNDPPKQGLSPQDKQLIEQRKKSLLEEIKAIRDMVSVAEKTPEDQGPVSQALVGFRQAMQQMSLAIKLEMTEQNFNAALLTVRATDKAARQVLAAQRVSQNRKLRIAGSKSAIGVLNMNLQPNETGTFPPGSTKQISKDTDRTVLGHGAVFKPVLLALTAVENSPEEKNLLQLEGAAKNYLADFDRRVKEGEQSKKPFKPDKITSTKAQTCRDALEKVRRLRATRNIQQEFNNLPQNPKTRDEENSLSRVRAKMIVESGGSKQLGVGESGASESFFLTDPTTGQKNFIFKPSDGEFDAGYGWPKGGGAPREVSLSAVSDILRTSTGLDCGVSPTTLVSVDSPSVATERNGNNPKRTGAIQNIVKADPVLSGKLNFSSDNYDAKYIDQFPPEEIEKVAILDFATLQMDRQGSNLLVSQDDPNKPPKLTPIDAGNALPSRKAFEAGRRMFANNAALSGAEGKKPFSGEALQKINDINEDEICEGLRQANRDMANIDPQAAQAVGDENIEMTRRSIRFLKKAASAGLSKAEIADAYANLFYKVLDAKPANKVDEVIDLVVKQQQAKPGVIQQIDQINKAQDLYAELGWPRDEFPIQKAENPERLLKLLTQRRENPAALKEIEKIVNEIGQQNLGFDPSAVPSVSERLRQVRGRQTAVKEDRLLDDPQTAQKMQQLGWTFTFVNDKGDTKTLPAKYQKAKHAQRLNDYVEAGGDDALKQRGLVPEKMHVYQKVYESLGGDAAIAELDRKGYNPYTGNSLEIRIADLEDAREYEKLGGDDAYVKVGGPQNKEVTLNTRVQLMKQKALAVVTDEADWLNADQALQSIVDLQNIIRTTAQKCGQAEQSFEKNRPLYAQYAKESDQPMDPQVKQQRLVEIKKADDEVGEQMKLFGKWNRDVITPWKDLQRLVLTNKLQAEPRVKKANRQLTQAYDAYVVNFGAADDLGKDQLDLLRGLKKKLEGQRGTVESVLEEIQKLGEQMSAPTFGAATKVNAQLEEINKFVEPVKAAIGKTDQYSEQQWDELAECDTKIRQALEIAKANYRALLRGKFNASEYLKQWKDNRVVEAIRPIAGAIKQADENFKLLESNADKLVRAIEKLESTRPKVDI